MRLFLALALTVIPVQAAEPQRDIICYNGWCRVQESTLKELLTSMTKLAAHTAELRALCGWKDEK